MKRLIFLFSLVFILFVSISTIMADSWNVELVGNTPGTANAVYVVGDYAYLCAGATLVILDVSNSQNPIKIGRINLPDIATGVYVSGSYAYVADEYSGLRVINISNPSMPQEVGFYDTLGDANGVYVSGSYAYVADGSTDLRVIDISDPSNPQEVGFYVGGGNALGVHVVGDFAYVAEGHADLGGSAPGLHVIDVSNPSNPQLVGLYRTPGDANGVYVSGSYAYVAEGFAFPDGSMAGFHVIDVSDPLNPQEVGFYDTPWSETFGVHVVGRYAYVAWIDGLLVMDVSSPSNPREVAICSVSGWAGEVYVSDGYAYLANEGTGLRVIDVSNPLNPKKVGFYDTPGLANDVYVSDSYAYVADSYAYNSGLHVIDVSDPSNPQEVEFYETTRQFGVVQVLGDYAYVGSVAGLRVIDVSNPLNPQEIGFCDTFGSAKGVYVTGDLAYVAAGNSGLRVIDVSDPSNPQEVGFYDTPGRATGVYVLGSYVYVASGPGGMSILRYTGQQTSILANIDSYFPDDPNNPSIVQVGQPTEISVTFTNTGNTAWQFIAGASVWDSNGVKVAGYEKTLDNALQPGAQTTVSWDHTVNQAGDYWLQFGVWKAMPYTAENLLDKKPIPSQKLIVGELPANQPPNKPINASPVNGATGVTITPTLESLPFSDPDLGDIHDASQWQITITPGDYSAPAFDSGVDANIQDPPQIIVSPGMLAENTAYYWRVKYKDNHGAWSEWSAETSFTTGVADLSISELSCHCITLDNQVISKANEVVIAAKIDNKGNIETLNIQVIFSDETNGNQIGHVYLPKLEANASAYVNTIWTLSSNISDHTIKVSIAETNSEAHKTVSIYYVDGISPFDLAVDAYSFRNWGLEDWEIKQYIADLISGWPIGENPWSWFPIYSPILSAKMEIGGHCFGMAATSILYRADPSLKPASVIDKTTYKMEKSIDVMAEIKKYQRSQLASPLEVWNQIETNTNNPRNEYETLLESIKSGKPMMLIMANSNKQAHCVVAYKVIDLGENEKRVYIYDNETYYKPNDQRSGSYINFDFSANDVNFTAAYYEQFFSSDIGFYLVRMYGEMDYKYIIAQYPGVWGKSVIDILKDYISNFTKNLTINNLAEVVLACPANATITDQYGRKIGYVNGSPINEIPGSSMEEHASIETYYLPTDLFYAVETTGIGDGTMDLYCVIPKGNQVSEVIYKDIPINTGTKTSLSMGVEVTDYIMQIDNDGDGVVDQTKSPDYYIEDIKSPLSISGTVKGSGWFIQNSNFRNSVMLDITCNNSIIESGSFLKYMDGQTRMLLMSTEVSSFTLSDHTVTLSGNCAVNKDIGYSFEVIIEDSNPDVFIIAVTGPEEFIYSSTGVLAGGDIVISTNIGELPSPSELPGETMVLQNYPNPFNPETWIPFKLSEDSDVSIEIYDVAGHLIRRLQLGYIPAGYYVNKDKAVYWDGRNEVGESVVSGVYFYRVSIGRLNPVKKMIILR